MEWMCTCTVCKEAKNDLIKANTMIRDADILQREATKKIVSVHPEYASSRDLVHELQNEISTHNMKIWLLEKRLQKARETREVESQEKVEQAASSLNLAHEDHQASHTNGCRGIFSPSGVDATHEGEERSEGKSDGSQE